MNDWTTRYADALATRLDDADPPTLLSPETIELVLDLARAVAHATERRNAPVATYLAGMFAAAKAARGDEALSALREARAIAQELE